MKRRFYFVFTLAALTVTGILLFQFYWVYNSYRTEKRNFNARIENALQNSMDTYALTTNGLPRTLRAGAPYLSVITPGSDTSAAPGPFPDTTGKLYNVRFQPLQVKPDNLKIVQGMMARLTFQALNSPVRLDIFDTLFKKELKKSNIDLTYKLILRKDQTMPEAIFPDTQRYLLRQTILPALVSALLILLSAGSLYYMGFIIRRQVRLDDIKNDFIDNITHELRTPVSILKSTHEALYKFNGAADAGKIRRYLGINFDVLDKLDNNISRLLDITNYEQGIRQPIIQPVALSELITGIIQRFNPDGQHDIRLEIEPDVENVSTDSYFIDTILSNLIDNALKYTNREIAIRIKVSSNNHGWQLQVRDNGPGIPRHSLPYIFDKFYRVPSGNLHEVKGYGIGLSYVRQLAVTLRGLVGVTSIPDAGTTFTINFPAHG